MLLLLTLAIVVLFTRFDGLLSIALSHAVTTNTTTRTTFNVRESIQYPCGTQRVEIGRPTWLVFRLDRYLQDIQDHADNITSSFNANIDVWVPPAYHHDQMPPVSMIDAASDATSTNMLVAQLLKRFYRDMASYLVAVYRSLATEQRVEDGGFGKSPTKHGLYKSGQSVRNALCSVTEMLKHIKQTVSNATLDSVLQLHWYQFPVNSVVHRYQNHVRQYSLGRDLKGTASALRHRLHINKRRFLQALQSHETHWFFWFCNTAFSVIVILSRL